MQLKKWVYSVPHSRVQSPFRTLPAGCFLQPPSPGSLAQTGFILSYASVLHRVLLSSVRPQSEDPGAFLGVRGPSSRHQPSASNAPSQSRLLGALPSSAFRTPSTVSSAAQPCGLISSHCHVQGSLFRGLLLVRSRSRFRATASLSSFHLTQLTAVAHRLHFMKQRPQGFHPRPNLVLTNNGLGDWRVQIPS